uniref:N-acetyltransferase domain-containing protein n=1 Tax=Oncorhynchus kisutch TaxID=8019 RepID=A0A8C7CRB8_ONCKI
MAADITIRRYQEDDKETVKEIFTMGMSEHVPSSFMHLLKQPLTQMILMVTFCALLASSKSQLVGYLFNSYIDTSLRKDLDHIQETYLENKDSCFWVAESDGRVVATVACLPAERGGNRRTGLTEGGEIGGLDLLKGGNRRTGLTEGGEIGGLDLLKGGK